MTTPIRDDHEIIRACLEGSQEAFAALVKRHEERAFWAAYRVLGDAEAARDVAQEAFVRVWRALDRFDFSMAFTTWLYRISVNLAIDHLRRNKRHKAVDVDILHEGLADESADVAPEAGQGARELAARVRRVLDTLDDPAARLPPVLAIAAVRALVRHPRQGAESPTDLTVSVGIDKVAVQFETLVSIDIKDHRSLVSEKASPTA